MNKSYLTLCLSSLLLGQANVWANPIEVITVTGGQSTLMEKSLATEQVTNPDVSSWLDSVPGANVNRNGPLTGIAQYRGLYGDRVSTSINGQKVIGAGPNAMDAPLSYSPAIVTESMNVYRGIAPVSAGTETLGGAIEVKSKKADFNDAEQVQYDGKLVASHASVNDANRQAGVLNIATNKVALLAYIDTTSANDTESAASYEVKPSEYHRTQTGLDLRYNNGNSVHGFRYDYTDTHDSGTASLPMDINYIYSNRFALDGDYELANGQLIWQVGYHDAEHAMDNFSMRTNNDLSKHKVNTAVSDSYDFLVKWQNDVWSAGVDGYYATHDATITNPNNAMFKVVNFNDVKDTRAGVFVQWDKTFADTRVQTGVRVNHISADANNVDHHMAGKNEAIGALKAAFNDADKEVTDTNVDMTLHLTHQLTNATSVSLALARKERAPSYQERYLWTPMEATGGLADGNTYLGDINLDSEVAWQSNLGLNYNHKNFSLMMDAYYQRIDDYIQGVPSTNPQAKMLAMMMSNDDNLLQFDNVEASLYGLDSYAHFQLNDAFSMSLIVSYVRGEREDINDDLYRIAPLKAKLKLAYQQGGFDMGVTLNGVAKQDKVSITNQEEETAGYAFVDAYVDYYFAQNWFVKTGVSNLFDREYVDHLGGYNRVNHTDTPVMERLPSNGRGVHAQISYLY